LETRLEAKIKKLVKEEILTLERELEKRMISQIKVSMDTLSDPEAGGSQKTGSQN